MRRRRNLIAVERLTDQALGPTSASLAPGDRLEHPSGIAAGSAARWH